MEIINTFDETISHYCMKLNHAQEELDLALKGLQELEWLAADGWQSQAGSAVSDKLMEIRSEALATQRDMEMVRSSLSQLGVMIEEEIQAWEIKMAAVSAASMGM